MWLQWFGEQSEPVQLAIIGLISALGAGLFGFAKEWRKPALRASDAVPAAGQPLDVERVLLDELAGIQVHLAEISKLMRDSSKNEEDNREEDSEVTRNQLDRLLAELIRIREEIIRLQREG